MALNFLRTILAGDENAVPQDTPSTHIDASGGFPFVGALSITNGAGSFTGTGVALSPEWILTAGHNSDLNDDGAPDAGLTTAFHLPGAGVFTVTTTITHPDFTGFGVPSVHDDLALLRLETPLPEGLAYPTMGALIGAGDAFTMVGFGRSGYGSYGYTTGAGLTVRRFGENVFDTFWFDDEGTGIAEVFRYDFDAPATTGQPGGSLGNHHESLIAPGDSGGPALIRAADGWAVAGINTFTDGFGGQFGDTGGGIVLHPYLPWIHEVTGLPVPEPGTSALLLSVLFLAFRYRLRPSATLGTKRAAPALRPWRLVLRRPLREWLGLACSCAEAYGTSSPRGEGDAGVQVARAGCFFLWLDLAVALATGLDWRGKGFGHDNRLPVIGVCSSSIFHNSRSSFRFHFMTP